MSLETPRAINGLVQAPGPGLPSLILLIVKTFVMPTQLRDLSTRFKEKLSF